MFNVSRLRVVLILLVIVLAVTAGSAVYASRPGTSGASPQAAASAASIADLAVATPGTPPNDVVLSPEEVRDASVGLSQFQQDLMKDGRLSFDDYKAAFNRYAGCLENLGGKPEGPAVITAHWKLTMSIAMPGGTAQSAAAIDGCRREYLSMIDQLWSMHTAPTKDELVPAREALAACMRDSGFSMVPEHPAPGELVQFWPGHGSVVPPQVFATCQGKIDDQYDLPGFGG